MRLKPLFTSILILASLLAFSRSNILPNGAKAEGMGNAFVSQFDVFSVYHNEAGLANIDRTSVGFFYGNQYLVKEMSVRAGLATFHTGSGNFAVQYNSFGPPLWSVSNGGIAYGRHLTDKLSAGIELCYFGTKFPEMNRTLATFSFDFGAIYQLNEKTFLGAHISNPYSTPIKTISYTEQIPWRVNFGGHTTFTETFLLSYEACLERNETPSVRVGAQWEAAENFFVRGGLNTGPSRLFAGLGYHSTFFDIEAAFSYRSNLGYTPSVSLVFSFM